MKTSTDDYIRIKARIMTGTLNWIIDDIRNSKMSIAQKEELFALLEERNEA